MDLYYSFRGLTEVNSPVCKEQMYIALNEDQQYRVMVRKISDIIKSSSYTIIIKNYIFSNRIG